MKLRIAVPLALLGVAVSFAAVVAGKEGTEVRHLTSAEFDEVVGDGKVHFIKWYAPWCGHCRRLAPTWSDLATEFGSSDRISISSVDCTKEQDLCSKHGVRGYPTLKVFYGGEEKDTFKGARSLDGLKEFAEQQAATLLDETDA